MSGRPDFSQPGSQGSGQTVAVSNRPELVYEDIKKNTQVASGDIERVELYSPTGTVWDVQNMRLHVTAPNNGETSGKNGLRVFSISGSIGVVMGESTYNKDVDWKFGKWVSADNLQRPQSEEAQVAQKQLAQATEKSPLIFQYDNQTDVSNSETRQYRVVVEENSY